jgi:esterase
MKLFYRKYGSGQPLIILHGLFGSSDNWVSIAKGISDRFTVILPDQRNHGQSPHSQIHDYNSMKEDLYELVNDLGWDKFFLAGHSMGGKTAVNFALTWPERLNGLLIVDISPLTRNTNNNEDLNMHLQILDFMLNENISGIRSRNEIDSRLSSRIKSEKVRELVMKNLKRESDNSFSWKLNAYAIRENFDRVTEGIGTASKLHGEITGFPVLFLKAEFSEYLPENDFAEILRIFPGAEFIMVPGSGHWIHADNPEAVKNYFLKFLDNS